MRMAEMRELVITERDGEFCVVSESGENMGCYATREEAEGRLEQVERFAGAEKPKAAQLAIDPTEAIIDRPGVRRAWLDLTREGDFAGYPTADGQGIQITRQTLEHLMASVKRAETPIPVDGGGISQPHEMVKDSGAPAAGWILDATIVEDKRGRGHLWGWVELMPEVAVAIEAGALLFGSVAYDEGGVDHETGAAVGATLHSYALTNKPFVPGLQPHRIDRELPGRYRVAASVKAAVMLGAAVTTEDQPMNEQKKATAPIKVAEPVEETGAVNQLAAQLAAAQAQIVELQARVATHEAADDVRAQVEAERAIGIEVAKICADQGLRLSEDSLRPLVALAQSQGPDAVRLTIAAVTTPPVGVTMSDEAPIRRFSNVDDAIDTMTSTVAQERPDANRYEVMRESLRRLSKTQPELV